MNDDWMRREIELFRLDFPSVGRWTTLSGILLVAALLIWGDRDPAGLLLIALLPISWLPGYWLLWWRFFHRPPLRPRQQVLIALVALGWAGAFLVVWNIVWHLVH